MVSQFFHNMEMPLGRWGGNFSGAYPECAKLLISLHASPLLPAQRNNQMQPLLFHRLHSGGMNAIILFRFHAGLPCCLLESLSTSPAHLLPLEFSQRIAIRHLNLARLDIFRIDKTEPRSTLITNRWLYGRVELLSR